MVANQGIGKEHFKIEQVTSTSWGEIQMIMAGKYNSIIKQ